MTFPLPTAPKLRAPSTLSLALLACVLGGGSVACDQLKGIGGGGTTDATATATPTPPPAPASAVTRYEGKESAETGPEKVRQTVRARKAADRNSEMIEILNPGTDVEKVAKYGGYTLVKWTSAGVTKDGWVETSSFTKEVVVTDAGLQDQNFPTIGTPGAGTRPTTSSATTTHTPVGIGTIKGTLGGPPPAASSKK